MWKWWSPLNPAASWVMAQHWGGLHAITALFHNWLVSQRARTCQHAGRQEGRQAGRMRLQHLPQAGMGMFLRVALHAEQHILSVEKMWMSPCVSVFVCAWTAVSWTSCIWHCVHLLFLFLHATVCQMYFHVHLLFIILWAVISPHSVQRGNVNKHISDFSPSFHTSYFFWQL